MTRRPKTASGLILLVLVAGIWGGIFLERAALVPGATHYEPAGVAQTFSVFWEAWDLVHQKYVDRSSIDPQKMTYGAVQGMLDSVGDVEHTRFVTPEDLRRETEALQGQLEGIGAEMVLRNGVPTVVAPIPGSPALAAGIRPGDTIVRVDGKEVTGLGLQAVVSMVRGPSGTKVTLSVVHSGESGLTDITITRARIAISNVTWTKEPGTSIAHVLLSQFGEHATDELADALQAARQAGATAIILDLRNDPGGYRDEAVGVASQFLKEGVVLIERDADGKQTDFPVKAGGVAQDLPLAVLVNEGSASAAEIVAGAIQDHGRARIIGVKTFGTGTVLGTFGLSDGSAVLLGIAEWLTPNGRQIWHHGIEPDIRVELPSGALPLIPTAEAGMTVETHRASKDAQLLRALQELGGI